MTTIIMTAIYILALFAVGCTSFTANARPAVGRGKATKVHGQ